MYNTEIGKCMANDQHQLNGLKKKASVMTVGVITYATDFTCVI